MESQGLNVLEGITGSFQYLTSTNDVNFVNGTFTGDITGSKINVTSSTAQEFILDNNFVGTPFVYSPTNLNLSASNAVVVTSSPFRLKSLTNSQTSSYTPQDGDLIFNSDRAAYMAYSGSDWQEIIISGFTASYASQALSSSYATTASYALNIPSNTGFPYTGSAEITGSLTVTGSILTDSTIEATASYAISSSISSISTNSVNSNTNSGSISWWSGTQAEFNAISSSADLGKIYFVI